jgi:hypothetical protein
MPLTRADFQYMVVTVYACQAQQSPDGFGAGKIIL